MAPAHSTLPRIQQQQQHQQQQQRDQSANPDIVEHGLFLEPMMGTPLAMYVHKDVLNHDRVVDLITVSSCIGHRSWFTARPQNSSPQRRVFDFIFENSQRLQCLLFSFFSWVLAYFHLTLFICRKMEAQSPTLIVGLVIS